MAYEAQCETWTPVCVYMYLKRDIFHSNTYKYMHAQLLRMLSSWFYYIIYNVDC